MGFSQIDPLHDFRVICFIQNVILIELYIFTISDR